MKMRYSVVMMVVGIGLLSLLSTSIKADSTGATSDGQLGFLVVVAILGGIGLLAGIISFILLLRSK